MSEWTKQPIKELLDGQWPGEWGSEPDHSLPSVVVYRSTDLDDAGHLLEDGGVYRFIPPIKLNAKKLVAGDILIEASGGAPDRPVGRAAQFVGSRGESAIGANFLRTLRPKKTVCTSFLRWALVALQQQSAIWRYQQQTTGMINLKVSDYLNHLIETPPLPEQRRIAEIISTMDEVIEQTETLITKYQQIKAGLMDDLFTRGITSDGHLRPTRAEAPYLYKESPLGWIPREWDMKPLSHIAESLVDGPFGSNLKTEHYVDELGVRVVRLQNIHEGRYNDDDRAFVSKSHADFLLRHTVNPGDVLVAALGEDSYPVGRACCYPDDLPPAINKADCYRLRCRTGVALNAFVMHFLNTSMARTQVRRFEQGVTRRRTNLGNFSRVVVSHPDIAEEERIVDLLSSASDRIKSTESVVAKLRQQKQGLMHDLLTGRVRVKVVESTSKTQW